MATSNKKFNLDFKSIKDDLASQADSTGSFPSSGNKNKGLLPQPVEGYLDIMEEHWGETDLTKVNKDLEKKLGPKYDKKFAQDLTASVYTGTQITNDLSDEDGDKLVKLQIDPSSGKIVPNKIEDQHIRSLKKLDGAKGNWEGQGPAHSILAGPDGVNRIRKFQRPVMNLLKIVRKLKDFSHLSEAYREKHMEVEHLTLTIRKLYYILIFIKDQIKNVAGVEDDVHRLIEMIVRETNQWKRFISQEQLDKLRLRQ